MARFAQQCVLRFVTHAPRQVLSPPPGKLEEAVVNLQLDPGVLAAAVGPIKLKVGGSSRRGREVLVMLGVHSPDDEVVMLPPARATRDLFGSLSEVSAAAVYARDLPTAAACLLPT